MNPIEILASTWIWYALFGVVAVLFFVRARNRRLATMEAMGSGWSGANGPDHAGTETASAQPTASAGRDDEKVPPPEGQPTPPNSHGGHGGHRRHGCC